MMRSFFLRCFLFIGLLAGCSDDRGLFSQQDVGTLVIDAVLFVDRPFPGIELTRGQRPDKAYDIVIANEPHARIIIEGGGQYVPYMWNGGGFYVPETPGILSLVQPNTTYYLTVVTQENERLTATTTTPPRLEVDEWVLLDDTGSMVERRLQTFDTWGDSVYYAPENQLVYSEGLFEVRLKPSTPAGYQVGVYSLDLESDFVIDPEFLDDEDFEEFERRISSYPILPSETNLRLPWFAIFFQGRYMIAVFAVDRNWYDLARSAEGFGGGGGFGGNMGENFERPIFNVNGGIGLFGSTSADTVGFFIHPRP